MGLVVAGCTDSASRTYPVSGTITFDGAPVESGSITFEDAAGGAGAASGGIKNGRYDLRSRPGKKKVSITAYRTKGDPNEPTPSMESYIPSKYNSQTVLTEEVVADVNRFDFRLTSK